MPQSWRQRREEREEWLAQGHQQGSAWELLDWHVTCSERLNSPVVVVRLADTASCSGDSVDRLSHDSCSCGEEKESDLHLGDLVATVGCALKCWM